MCVGVGVRSFICNVCISLLSFPSLFPTAMDVIGYLFLRRQPLSWSQTLYGVFNGYSDAVFTLFVLFGIPFLKVRLRWRDTTLMLVGVVSQCIGQAYMGFCVVTWMVFLGEAFRISCYPQCNSFMKLAPPRN